MSVLSARPSSPLLARFVESLHSLDGGADARPATLERILPNGRVHLMVNLYEDEFRTYHGSDCAAVQTIPGAVLAGPGSQPSVIDTREQRCLATVDFKPGGAAPFFASPLSDACGQLVDLGQLWGRDGALLRERLLAAPTPYARLRVLEAVLLHHLVGPREPDPAIAWAARAFDRGAAVNRKPGRLPPGSVAEDLRASFSRTVGSVTKTLFTRTPPATRRTLRR